MECKCQELRRCRQDLHKLGNALSKATYLQTKNGIVQFQSGRLVGAVPNTYISKRRAYIQAEITPDKTNVNCMTGGIGTQIQAQITALSNKIILMEREDEQFHIQEAMRKREEERRKALEASK